MLTVLMLACAAWLHHIGVIAVAVLVCGLMLWRAWIYQNRSFAIMAFLALCCVSYTTIFSASQWQALDRPTPTQITATATVLSDAAAERYGVTAIIEANGRRYLARVSSAQASSFRSASAGEHYVLRGTTTALHDKPWLRRKHVAAQLNITSVQYLDAGNAMSQLANGMRALIARGAYALPPVDAALLTGFVYGDNREEPDWLKEDFRDAGLSHLLAVSGQNVAFIFVLLMPAIGGLRSRGRFLACCIALLLFGTITRWEPSVIRAEAMALVALIATYRHRTVVPVQVLCLGVGGALLLDPFLIGSVGFLLSTTACLGMALVGKWLTDRLHGPLWFRASLGFSFGAQLGVMPVQWIVFHTVPRVGLFTNIAAEPMAGLVMMWGVVGGALAGISELAGLSYAAEVLHYPSRAMLGWIRLVASTGATVEHHRLFAPLVGIASLCLLVALYRAGKLRAGGNPSMEESFRVGTNHRVSYQRR